MSLQQSIPNQVFSAIRLPENRRSATTAIAARDLPLHSGNTCAGAQSQRARSHMDKYEFGRLLGQRGVLRHFNKEKLMDALDYASGKYSERRFSTAAIVGQLELMRQQFGQVIIPPAVLSEFDCARGQTWLFSDSIGAQGGLDSSARD